MKPGRSTKTAQPGRLLAQAAGAQRTGALVVDGTPGGTLHLVDGHVTYAESPAAPGVGELLTASGRLAARTWQAAVDAGAANGEVGQLLVRQGHLTQGELELCVLGAIYDAAYFVLRADPTSSEFVDGTTHWLGTVVRVDAAAVSREAARRARLLDEIFPHGEIDTAPVTPVARPPLERVALTAQQWELLVHADGQRTPADLAQLLGRAGYATVQELRRLAGQGLLEMPRPRDRTGENVAFVRLPHGGGPSVDVRRPAVPVPPAPPVVSGASPVAGAPAAPGGTPGPDEPVDKPRLPRRRPNARLPKGMLAADGTTQVHPGTDEVLLKRIRTALRALR